MVGLGILQLSANCEIAISLFCMNNFNLLTKSIFVSFCKYVFVCKLSGANVVIVFVKCKFWKIEFEWQGSLVM